MTEKYPADVAESRRRRLDELFADQPYLSPTMMASRLHERLDDDPPPVAFPVLPPEEDEVILRLIEGRRSQMFAAVPSPPGVDIPVRRPEPEPAPLPPSRPGLSAPAQPEEGLTRVELLVDFRSDPPRVRAVSGSEPDGPEIMTAREAAAFLRVSETTVRAWAGQGRLPCARLGRRLRFRRDALVGWLKTREQPAD